MEGNNVTTDILPSPGSPRKWASFCVQHQPLICLGTAACCSVLRTGCVNSRVKPASLKHFTRGTVIALIHSMSWGQSVSQEHSSGYALAFPSIYIRMWKTPGRSEHWCVEGCMLDTPGNYQISQRICTQCQLLDFLLFFHVHEHHYQSVFQLLWHS